jgi:cell wall-associated NlpC family hydrolase
MIAPALTCRIDEWVNRWIGARHAYDGRTDAGIDCYGLVVRFYAEIYGIELPDWTADALRSGQWEAERQRRWLALDLPVDPCIAIVRRRATLPSHVGIYWRGRIVHAVERGGVQADTVATFIRAIGRPEYGVPLVESSRA